MGYRRGIGNTNAVVKGQVTLWANRARRQTGRLEDGIAKGQSAGVLEVYRWGLERARRQLEARVRQAVERGIPLAAFLPGHGRLVAGQTAALLLVLLFGLWVLVDTRRGSE